VIYWQFQSSYELILVDLSPAEALIEAEWGSQSEEELSQVFDLDEGRGVWVETGPHVPEPVVHVMVEEPAILRLGVFVTLQDDRNEDFQEDKVDDESI
jgi:hypothetical protein